MIERIKEDFNTNKGILKFGETGGTYDFTNYIFYKTHVEFDSNNAPKKVGWF